MTPTPAASGGVEVVLVALIGALGLVLVAMIPVLVSIARNAATAARTSREVRHEVRNDHQKNMRDDVDDKHAEIMRQLRAHGRRLGRLERRLDVVDERTQPRPRTTTKRRTP